MISLIAFVSVFIGFFCIIGGLIGIALICLQVCWAIFKWIWGKVMRVDEKKKVEQRINEIRLENARQLSDSRKRYAERLHNLNRSLRLSRDN